MTSRLLKKLPATVVTADTTTSPVDLFTFEEYQKLIELRERVWERTRILHQLEDYEQYQRLLFMRWLVSTGRFER